MEIPTYFVHVRSHPLNDTILGYVLSGQLGDLCQFPVTAATNYHEFGDSKQQRATLWFF